MPRQTLIKRARPKNCKLHFSASEITRKQDKSHFDPMFAAVRITLKVRLKSSLSYSKTILKLLQNDPKTTPKRSQSYSKMIPKSVQNDPKVTPKCSQSYSNMIPKSVQNLSTVITKST